MKTEQEKYWEAIYKLHELKSIFNEMLPDTKASFIHDVVQIFGAQQMVSVLQNNMSNK